MKQIIIAGLCILVGLLALPQAPAKAYVVANSWPVVEIHGFESASSDDCNTVEFPGTKAYLSLHGWTGAVISLGLYTNDTNCDVSVVNWSALHDTTDSCALDYEIPGADGTNNEDLRHVACEVDRYLWDNWWSKGWNVDVIAHSMGGLIIQWGLAAQGNSLPPQRYTQDVYTGGTPYSGLAQQLSCGNCLQSQQLLIGSSFLAALATHGSPQGTAGTRWTMIGSNCDSSSSLAMDGGTKVNYLSPCPLHGQYFGYDYDGNDDASVQWSSGQPANVVNQSSTTFMHPLHFMTRVLEGWQP